MFITYVVNDNVPLSALRTEKLSAKLSFEEFTGLSVLIFRPVTLAWRHDIPSVSQRRRWNYGTVVNVYPTLRLTSSVKGIRLRTLECRSTRMWAAVNQLVGLSLIFFLALAQVDKDHCQRHKEYAVWLNKCWKVLCGLICTCLHYAYFASCSLSCSIANSIPNLSSL
jgi:cytochrome bd-type quinol oxidase subunit 2